MSLYAPFRASDLGPEDDGEDRREAALERQAAHEADDVQYNVYWWLAERFGENAAIALTDPDGYDAAEILDTVKEARITYFAWRNREAMRIAQTVLED